LLKEIPFPRQQLSKDSIKAWLINEMILNMIGFIVLGVLFYLDYYFSWREWIGWILIILTVSAIIDMFFSPLKMRLRYKHWRFGISEEFLQLKSGVINEKHQLIPMARIQSVTIHQGPILRKYNLYNIKVNTITTGHIIPALYEKETMELRKQIAHYANVKEPEA
jgi:hypothetical protein